MSTAVTRRTRTRVRGASAAPERTDAAASLPRDAVAKVDVATGDNASRDEATSPRRKYALTDKAIEQRKAAAQNSTGPTSVEGKATSSRNPVTHGMTAFATSILVDGEDPAAYEELYQGL